MAGFASASARRVWGWTDLYPAPTRFPSTSSHVGHHYGRTRRVGAVHAARDASATITRTGDPEFSVIVEDLRVSLGPASSQRQVINGINLRIKRGSLHMLLGPNGCGKSTLLKVNRPSPCIA